MRIISSIYLPCLFFLLLACSGTLQYQSNHHIHRSQQYMVATQGIAASKAAVEVLDKGGNIYDAFTAVSFVMAVERPQSTGIGGGGFLLEYHAESEQLLAHDFREMAPSKAHKKMFLDQERNVIPRASVDGAAAVATPGLVRGVLGIHREKGSLPLDVVLAPAIRLAENGFEVYPHLHRAIIKRQDALKKYDQQASAIFFDEQGEPLEVGSILVQKDLAASLKLIAKKGEEAFYQGPIAKAMLEHVQKTGGFLTQEDLDHYQVKKRKPLIGEFLGYEIATMPPPSSGGVHLLQILNILEFYPLKSLGADSSDYFHLLATAMQIAFADRAKYMGDSDFVDIPLDRLKSKEYAAKALQQINTQKALPSKNLTEKKRIIKESDDTVHFTIMDRQGNTLSSTQTINGLFGSAVMVPGWGIILNNEMDDFASKPGEKNIFGAVGGENNLIEPHKRPLSSMTPSIVFHQAKPVLALGSPSGTRIISCVAQVILQALVFEQPLDKAVAAGRIHHQWYPEKLFYEEGSFDEQTALELELKGHRIEKQDLGCKVQAISRHKNSLFGVSDHRGEGMAIGR